jgi:hypothetical protein
MAKKKILQKPSVVIYQAKSGAIELHGDFGKETIWATQAQIAEVFDIERTVVTKHIGNVLKSGEVDEKSNVQKMHIANSDKPVAFYSLDIILAVGYRSNSARAIEFRKWATKTLRGYIVDGFAINRSRIAKNYTQFLSIVADIKKLLPEVSTIDTKDAVELISLFADTWLSLDAYDRELLLKGKLTERRFLCRQKMCQKISLPSEKLLLQKAKQLTYLVMNETQDQCLGLWVM